MTQLARTALWAILVAVLAGCTPAAASPEPVVLRLATTTSTNDSGLLEAILPDFEATRRARVDVIAVGTGQAIEMGRSGDVEILLVHNRTLEDDFVADGYGVERFPVMFNDFVLVGPPDDPAGIASATTATEGLRRIYDRGSTFVSRGDDSGTHARELTLWESADRRPSLTDTWYLAVGQGMAETLLFAEEEAGYTLSDRGTYLAMAEELPGLAILFGGETIAENPDPMMQNPYAVIPVTPEDPESPEAILARDFVDWLVSLETQTRISTFGVDRFGQPLFYPSSLEWCAQAGEAAPGCAAPAP